MFRAPNEYRTDTYRVYIEGQVSFELSKETKYPWLYGSLEWNKQKNCVIAQN